MTEGDGVMVCAVASCKATSTSRATPTSCDESMPIIRFRDPRGIDMPYLLADSFMSRPNTIVCPGSKMPLSM